jgi:hypothetical protein
MPDHLRSAQQSFALAMRKYNQANGVEVNSKTYFSVPGFR